LLLKGFGVHEWPQRGRSRKGGSEMGCLSRRFRSPVPVERVHCLVLAPRSLAGYQGRMRCVESRDRVILWPGYHDTRAHELERVFGEDGHRCAPRSGVRCLLRTPAA
jgi:hypothetical protein